MTDYTKTTDFAVKDGLASGNAAKAAKGTEIDTELDNIATAVATKYDVNDRGAASGIAPLDGSALLPAANLPVATEVAIGALEIATELEAEGLVVDDKIVTPLKLDDVLGNAAGASIVYTAGVFNVNSSGLGTTVPLTTDTVPYYDVSVTGERKATWASVNTVFTLAALSDYDANDHIDHSTVTMTAGTGLTGGGTLEATRTFNLDISALTNMDISETAAADSVLVNDGGTMKQMDVRDMGIRVVNSSVAQTFDIDDAQTLQLLTGATPIAFDIPPNGTVAYGIGTIIYVGSRDTASLTISPNTSAVRLTSTLRSDVGPSAGDHTVTAGGIAAIIKVATDEWMITGDIA